MRITPTTILIYCTSLWASTTTTAVRVYNSIYMTLCTEQFNCYIFGTTTAVTTVVVVVAVVVVLAAVDVVVVVVIVLTLTHRYNAVRGHRTGSNNLYSSSSVPYAPNIMRLFLDGTRARGAQIRYVTVYTHIRLAFWRGECLYHRPLGVWLF